MENWTCFRQKASQKPTVSIILQDRKVCLEISVLAYLRVLQKM